MDAEILTTIELICLLVMVVCLYGRVAMVEREQKDLRNITLKTLNNLKEELDELLIEEEEDDAQGGDR